jgi:hypothetical protein
VKKQYATLLALLILLGGCVQWTLVESKRVSVGDLFTVQPETNWNRLVDGHTQFWTLDGVQLQMVRFMSGLKEGDKFVPNSNFTANFEKLPSYKESMSPIEVAEFIEASYSQLGTAKIETSNLGPSTVGGKPGFRFDITIVLESGLEKQGFAYGFQRDKKLYLMMYTAARLHFYDRDVNKAKNLIRSIQFKS